ncbi:MAG: hypothetical protein ACREV9_16500, partial [Burkholderiales bacterium]
LCSGLGFLQNRDDLLFTKPLLLHVRLSFCWRTLPQIRTISGEQVNWAQPLLSGGQFVGVMYLFSTEPQVFPRAVDRQTLNNIAGNIVAILEAATII